MAKKVIKNKNVRKELQEKIKEALARKARGSGGVTAQEAKKIFNNNENSVPNTRKVQNQRSDIQRNLSAIPRSQNMLQMPRRLQVSIINDKTPPKLPEWTEKAPPSGLSNKFEHVDVSIIVPMYRSNNVIVDQIYSWDLDDDGLVTEIIYVDDGCPNESHKAVSETWEKRKDLIRRNMRIRIIRNKVNGGFSAACNNGANVAVGDYLIFLNADVKVKSNWIKPMWERVRSNSKIGIVGNLHIKDSKIDSAGSEWIWKHRSFRHIGRNSYNGKDLPRQLRLDEIPASLVVAQERDMVTGACFIIPRRLFMDLEGFDLNYRIGYWEDSDLCMRVKSAGYQIWYEPRSMIIHDLGHSKAGRHAFYNNNVNLFRERWIDTYRIDEHIKFPRKDAKKPDLKRNINGKVYGCVIACNEEEFLEASVDSAAPLVDEWIFVIGGNQYAYKAGMCNNKGYPSDKTLSIAKKCVEKYGGKIIEPPGRLWKDKVEMRNAYAQFLKQDDWMFMLDGDEVYKTNQLWRITELMKNHEVLILQFWLFWNNIETIGTGKWEMFPQERFVKWKDGYCYWSKNHLHVYDMKSKKLVKEVAPTFHTKTEKLFYHYSWVRPIEKIRQKLLYYKYQSGNNNDSYVNDIFLKWRSNPDIVRGNTHPMKGGDWKEFSGIHPMGIQKLIDKGKLNF